MLEFTISLVDDELEFEPFREEPWLEFMLPPTARIGWRGKFDILDNVHLAPVPVHCFFNAVVFANWLADSHGISSSDAFSAYLLHDMFKALLNMVPSNGGRSWQHEERHGSTFFGGIEQDVESSSVFENFDRSFKIAADHGRLNDRRRGVYGWKESTWHERGIEVHSDVQTVGLAIKLQPALSNILAIMHLKNLFIEAYVAALREEYKPVFQKFEEITYQYQFLPEEPGITIDELCRKSRVTLADRKLRIETFIGAKATALPGQRTRIKLPFWTLLTLQEDPTSIIFPVPAIRGQASNSAFVDKVEKTFYQKVETLLRAVPSRGRRWADKLADLLTYLGETICVESGDFAKVQAAKAIGMQRATCGLCSSPVSENFVCLPERDLGWNSGRYTDWHIGDARSSVCLLCAISYFKAPPQFMRAQKLVKQRQLIYFSINTPHARVEKNLLASIPKGELLPFFQADITPRLITSSLESLVTLNIIGALFLQSSIRAIEVRQQDGELELWLNEAIRFNPFSFVGEIGKAKGKRALPELLFEMQRALGRHILVLDPMLWISVEVPFHTLVCVMGTKQGKHFELKFKPLAVSNEANLLPVVCEGYHIVDSTVMETILQVRRLLQKFRTPKVSDRMKVTALTADPQEFVTALIELGGFNYETIYERLWELANGGDVYAYLQSLRTAILRYPVIQEMWG